MNTINNKQLLRQKCRYIRDSFGEMHINKASERACKILTQTPEFLSADTILIYYPTKNEISPLPILEVAQKSGKRIALPVCNMENNSLSFHIITSIDEVNPSHFGICEPPKINEEPIVTERTLALIPALAFSKKGHRLGYGRGFYDRFLADFKGISAGLSYSELVFDKIPHEDHDIPLKMLITESEVLYFVE
ncbi:MAG: 5-formyltetrahydrofolate cyclo-ligase [Clostridia bacterium]|nr:5-formyltetrahydrofolate cyclo-ligase [Clostridia bacterium]